MERTRKMPIKRQKVVSKILLTLVFENYSRLFQLKPAVFIALFQLNTKITEGIKRQAQALRVFFGNLHPLGSIPSKKLVLFILLRFQECLSV